MAGCIMETQVHKLLISNVSPPHTPPLLPLGPSQTALSPRAAIYI